MRRLALLCLLTFVAACGGDDDDVAAPTTTTTSRPPSTTTTTVRSPRLGDPVELQGVVVGVHPTKPIAYVSIVEQSTEGCEGGDIAHLYAQPLTGGDPVEVGPSRMTSGTVLNGGAGDRVAVVDQCEGFLSSVSTAVPRDDGTFADIRTVDTTAAEVSGQLQPGTIRWGADGESFVALVHDLEGEGSRVVRIHLDGTVDELDHGEGLIAVEELADGQLAVATASSVTIGDVAIASNLDFITSLAVRPDRRAVAIAGKHGVDVHELGDAPDGATAVTGNAASVASWSVDGTAIAYLRVDGDEASAWLHRGTDVEVSPRAGFGAPLLTADGSWVLYNEAVDDGQGYALPHARARAIS